MPFLISWDDEAKTAVRIDAVGQWSIEEYRKLLNEIVGYFLSVSHPVYIIANMLQSGTPPMGIVWNARYAFQRFPSNYSGAVIVTIDNFVRNVVSTVGNLYVGQTGRFVTARTLEEAGRLIERWRIEDTTSWRLN